MALKKPLALYSGRITELKPGDQIDIEMDSAKLQNKDAVTVNKLEFVALGTSNGSFKQALADTFANGHVLGISTETVAVDAIGVIQTDGLVSGTLAGWTGVLEDANPLGLTLGSIYYLSKTAPGKITSIPPIAPGVSTRVGRALSDVLFDLNIDYPIELS